MADQSDQKQDGQTAQISGTVQIKQNGSGERRDQDQNKREDDEAPEKKKTRTAAA